MAVLEISRYFNYASLLVSAPIVLGLDASIIAKDTGDFTIFFIKFHIPVPSWASLGVAISAITIASIITFLLIDMLKTNGLKSKPLFFVELGWFSALWIIWLAAFIDLATNIPDCSNNNSVINDICGEIKAAEAFTFTSFFTSISYWLTLVVISVIRRVRSQRNRSTEDDRTAPSTGAPVPAVPAMTSSSNTPVMYQQARAEHGPSFPSSYPPAVTQYTTQHVQAQSQV